MSKNIVLTVLLTLLVLPSALLAQRRLDTLWVARYTGVTGSNDVAYGVHIDAFDNCYVHGRSTGADTSNDIILLKYAPDSTLLWERRYEGPGPGHDVPAWRGLAADGAGNIYITGYSMGAGSGYDIVVIKYDTAGTEHWVRRYNGAANLDDVPNGIAIDSSGNVAVTGFTTVAGGTRDVVIIKYNTDGDTAWVRTHNGPASGNDVAKAICADANGNFIVVGYERAVTTGFLTAKYDSTGTQLWTAFFDWRPHASLPDSALVVTVDESGNIYVSGASMWHTGFQPSYSWSTLKYSPGGTRIWVDSGYQSPIQYPRWPHSILYDRPRGRIIMAGVEVMAPSGTGPDMAFYAFDTGGTVLWRRTVSSASQGASDWAYRAAVSTEGAVFGCGFFSRGNPNGMVYGTVKLSPAGALLWTADHGYDPPSQATVAEDLAFDSQGNLYVTGYYQWNSGDSSRNIGTIKYAFRDAAVTDVVMPERMDTSDWVYPKAVIKNLGSYTDSARVFVRMRIGAGYVDTATVALAHGAADTVRFRLYKPTTYGTYVVRCSTFLAGDCDATNSQKQETLYVQRWALDVAAMAIEAPKGRVASGAVVTPVCSLLNSGATPCTYTARMKIGTSYNRTATVSNHDPGTWRRVTFPNWTASGTQTLLVRCTTELTGDQRPKNDAKTGFVAVGSGGFGITNVWPPYGGNTGTVMVVIEGWGFIRDSIEAIPVKLTNGTKVITDSAWVSDDSALAVARFNLNGAPVGEYTLVARNGDGDSAVVQGFDVQPGVSATYTTITGPSLVRRRRSASYTIRMENLGNVDMLDGNVGLGLDVPSGLKLTRLVSDDGLELYNRDSVATWIEQGRRLYPEEWVGVSESLDNDNKVLEMACEHVVERLRHTLEAVRWIETFRANLQAMDANPGQNLELKACFPCLRPPEPSSDPFQFFGMFGVGGALDDELSLSHPEVLPIMERARAYAQHMSLTHPELFGGCPIGGQVARELTADEARTLSRQLNDLQQAFKMMYMLLQSEHQNNMDVIHNMSRCGVPREESAQLALLQREMIDALGFEPEGALEDGTGPRFVHRLLAHEMNSALGAAREKLRSGGTCGGGGDAGLSVRVSPSIDPNFKCGPDGADSLRGWILTGRRFYYEVHFENVDTALAPADSVTIVDTLDADLDLLTLEFDTVSHPAVCTTVFDPASRTITWVFNNIELVPNKNPPEGEGYVAYSIEPKTGLASGTEIRNRAHIYFDENAGMATNEWLNTIDGVPPVTRVRPLPETTNTAQFTVRWGGHDDVGGSGIHHYNVWCMEDTVCRGIWKSTTDTMATFTGANETRYYFQVVAADSAGNAEAKDTLPEAWTFVTGLAVPEYIYPPDTTLNPAGFVADSTPYFLWTATAGSGGTYTLQYSTDSTFSTNVESVVGLTWYGYFVPDSTPLADTTWYWRAEAVGRLGVHSGYRAPRRFSVDTDGPSAPALYLPADSSVVTDSQPTFVWSRVPGATQYILRLVTDTLVDTLAANGARTSDTTFTVTNFAPLRDTTYRWVVRALDGAGNLSPIQAHPFQFRVTTQRMISGNAAYYAGNLGEYPPIESVKVLLTGAMQDTVLTDTAGAYLFTDLTSRVDYAASAEKTNTGRDAAVSAFDAAMALRHAVHVDTLDSLQFVAGDVSGDSSVSAFDAGLMLQYAVGMRRHFPAGYRPSLDTVDWSFLPPQRTYDTLRMNMGDEDYSGILYGDPSGNWPAALLPEPDGIALAASARYFAVNLPTEEESRRGQSQVKVQIADIKLQSGEHGIATGMSLPQAPDALSAGNRGQETAPTSWAIGEQRMANGATHSVAFPVTAKAVRNGLSADMLVKYDARRYTLTALRTTEATEGFMAAATDLNGTVRIAMAGARPLNGDVTLLELVFTAANGQAPRANDQSSLNVQAPNREAPVTLSETKGRRASQSASDNDRRFFADVQNDRGEVAAQVDKASTANRGQETAPTSEAVGRELSAVSREPIAEIVWLVINEPVSKPVVEMGGAMAGGTWLPVSVFLDPPRPNPFGTGTNIGYGLPATGDVRLQVFDAVGRCVRTLAQGKQKAGRYTVAWNGKDQKGRQVANGIYFVKLQTDRLALKRKATLIGR